MSERVGDAAEPPAVRLFDRDDHARARGDRAGEQGIGIGHGEDHADGAAAERLGAEVGVLGRFVGHPELRVVDRQPRHDRAGRVFHAVHLRRAERRLVEVHGARAVSHRQQRRDRAADDAGCLRTHAGPRVYVGRPVARRPLFVYNVETLAGHLGALEQAVLLALVRPRTALGREAYGRAILKEVQHRLDREVAAGAVYATLERLEAKGLVASRLGPGTPVRGGRPKRHYTIRPDGIRA